MSTEQRPRSAQGRRPAAGQAKGLSGRQSRPASGPRTFWAETMRSNSPSPSRSQRKLCTTAGSSASSPLALSQAWTMLRLSASLAGRGCAGLGLGFQTQSTASRAEPGPRGPPGRWMSKVRFLAWPKGLVLRTLAYSSGCSWWMAETMPVPWGPEKEKSRHSWPPQTRSRRREGLDCTSAAETQRPWEKPPSRAPSNPKTASPLGVARPGAGCASTIARASARTVARTDARPPGRMRQTRKRPCVEARMHVLL